MLDHEALSRHPGAFRSLTGMSPDEFEALLVAFQEALARRRQGSRTTRAGQPRQRAAGAGHPHRHDERHRLLLALVWLRVYPTYELLGFLFGLHKRNAQLNVRDALAALDTLDDFPFQRPDRQRKKLRSAEGVMAAFPEVRLIVDSKEQRVNRPNGQDEQRPYYSGKKKAHTVKTQVAVDARGRVEAVSGSVPGSTHDLTLLRASGVLGLLGEGEGAMMDKGYCGVAAHYPGVPVVLPYKKPRGGELSDEQRAFNRQVARRRIVVEHTMAQLNRFTVLRQVFRGKQRDRHSGVVRVVARLVNRRLAVKPLKSYAG